MSLFENIGYPGYKLLYEWFDKGFLLMISSVKAGEYA